MSYDPEYSVEPSDFPDPDDYLERIGTCLSCGRPVWGLYIEGKPHPVDCPCWEIEPEDDCR